jgi:hypothetical protein
VAVLNSTRSAAIRPSALVNTTVAAGHDAVGRSRSTSSAKNWSCAPDCGLPDQVKVVSSCSNFQLE